MSRFLLTFRSPYSNIVGERAVGDGRRKGAKEMNYQVILYEKMGRIATVTFNRLQRRNAWNDQVTDEFIDVFHRMEADPEVLVTILTGNQEGRAFSAGADLKDPKTHAANSVADHVAGIDMRGMELFNCIADYPKPVIAAINGYAIGVGFQVCLCCDILLAAEEAQFGLPQVALGIMPAYGGALRLARFVGKGKAMEMVLTGEHINAQEGHRVGLLNRVLSLTELMPAARELALKLTSLPPNSVRMAKESLNKGLDIGNMKDAAQTDIYRFMALTMTRDSQEAHQAWREKRAPVVRGE
ncbi:MAG: enoyl-CoA hydratase-related protein [Dehalococcoidia bacterium]|nr:enoyl-CoA hydratase-related protein [Dehalococcoidia bacterium]